MAKRRKIGIKYEYNENWIGGGYYIQNLISALNNVHEKNKPILFIFTDTEKHFEDLKKVTKYPYLHKRDYTAKLNILQRILNKASRTLFKTDIFSRYYKVDVLFPASKDAFKSRQKRLYWIPDFQEHYYPSFFTSESVVDRKVYQAYIVAEANNILLSSESAKDDFNKIYPLNKLKQFVLPFAVTHPEIDFDENICAKYHLPEHFFICSNQFWKHKNHEIFVQTLSLLKQRGSNINVVFTGKEYDYRNPDYFNKLKTKFIEEELIESVFFLGFIDRKDQLLLMKKSVAVIQPSLFEGWSTVIEDAKALNTFILASDLEVHKEQLLNYQAKLFFSPEDAKQLANCVLKIKQGTPEHFKPFDYSPEIIRFARNFIKIYETVITQ